MTPSLVIGEVTTSLQELPTPSQYSVVGPTSLEVAMGRLFSVDSSIAIPAITASLLGAVT